MKEFNPESALSDGKDAASTTEELELELEALDIADEPLEMEGSDEVENEELAKKLLDEQGEHERAPCESRTGTSADVNPLNVFVCRARGRGGQHGVAPEAHRGRLHPAASQLCQQRPDRQGGRRVKQLYEKQEVIVNE